MSWIRENVEDASVWRPGRPACAVLAVAVMMIPGWMRLLLESRQPGCEE